MQAEYLTVHGVEDTPRRPAVTVHFDGGSLSCGRFGVLPRDGLEVSVGPWVWLGPGVASVGRAVRLRSGDRVVRLGARQSDAGGPPRRAAVIGQVDIVLSPRDLRALLALLNVTGDPVVDVFELVAADRSRRRHALAPVLAGIAAALALAVALGITGVAGSMNGRMVTGIACLILIVWGIAVTIGRAGRMATPARALTIGPDEIVLYGRRGTRISSAATDRLRFEWFTAPRRDGPVLALALTPAELTIGAADPDLAGTGPVRAPHYLVDGRWEWRRLVTALGIPQLDKS